MKKIVLSYLFILAFSCSWATDLLSAQDYIQLWKDEAVYQMALHKIPASITLAQGMLESGNGNSRLAKEGNNHFGIKCHNDWDGKKIYEDDETRGECFRHYQDARESFEDHSSFLQKPRYQPLFELNTTDYKSWAKGLKDCGYATNPKYPQLLIKLIEENQLYVFDEEGMDFIAQNNVPEHRGSTSAPKANTSAKPKKDGHKSKNEVEGSQITVTNNREVIKAPGRLQYVVAKAGDTTESIAKDFDLNALFIRKFNDLKPGQSISAGQTIYVKPKRNKALTAEHSVAKEETWWSISQKEGIKLRKLLKWNNATNNTPLSPGKMIRLQP
jgi:LysM repeat protein